MLKSAGLTAVSTPKKTNKHLVQHQFKPGTSGNPGGRPPIPEELKQARKLNQIKVSELVIKFMNMTVREIEEITKNPDTQGLDSMIARIILEAQKYGDQSRCAFILDRGVGKLQETIQHKLPKPTVVKLIGEQAALVLGNAEEEDEE